MAKLIKAEFVRLFKNKLFWFLLTVLMGVSVYYLNGSIKLFSDNKNTEYQMYLFEALPVIIFASAVLIAFFTGTLFSQKVIKNQIVCGYSKTKIFVCDVVVLSVVSIIYSLTTCINGLYLVIAKGYSARIYFSYIALIVITYLTLNILSVTLSFVISNKAVSIVAVCLALLSLFIASSKLLEPKLSESEFYMEIDTINGIPYEQYNEVIYNDDLENGNITYKQVRNPDYMTGTKRKIYQFVYDILPTTQTYDIAHVFASTESEGFNTLKFGQTKPQAEKITDVLKPKLIICNLGWIVFLSTLGAVVFKKKQIS